MSEKFQGKLPPYYQDRIDKDKLRDAATEANYNLAVLEAKELLTNTAVSNHTKSIVRDLLKYGKANLPGMRVYA